MKNSLGLKFLLVFIIAAFALVSCERNKKVNTDDALVGELDKTENLIEQGFTKVTVTTEFADEGCPYLLMAKTMGDTELLQPLVLEDACKEHGKVIYIKFRPSRAPSSGECKTGSLISIDEVRFE